MVDNAPHPVPVAVNEAHHSVHPVLVSSVPVCAICYPVAVPLPIAGSMVPSPGSPVPVPIPGSPVPVLVPVPGSPV